MSKQCHWFCPWIAWNNSMESMDTIHGHYPLNGKLACNGKHGNFPWKSVSILHTDNFPCTPWTKEDISSVDTVHGKHGPNPQSMDTFHGIHGNTPWTISRKIILQSAVEKLEIVHGSSFQYSTRKILHGIHRNPWRMFSREVGDKWAFIIPTQRIAKGT